MKATALAILGFSLATVAAGCNGAGVDAAETQVAVDGDEGVAASVQSTDLASVVFENVSVTDPKMATAQLSMPSQLWPSGCVTRAQTGPSQVTVTFTDCTGPFGLVHIDGQEVVDFAAAPSGALQATIRGVGLTADGRPITQSATAVITFPGSNTRAVAWNGSWQRTNDLGEIVQHTSDLRISLDLSAGCRTINGSAQTHVDAREVNTTITGYEMCHDAMGQEGCPSGSVDHVGVTSGKTVEIHFNGTSEAQVTGARGDTFQVPLVCTPLPTRS
jgi:hypothetical protein